ncbi:hypothetical protein GCM10009838_15900 [Catenulispora subtropica]|uniref:TetR family transcriptional regulator n=1 Tax=Catenulispora subtropica TaxID=450798 RepID=A0ABP5CBD1_9ACTN
MVRDGAPGDHTQRGGYLRSSAGRLRSPLRGKALQIQMDAQQEIARALSAAFPDQLDRVTAAALAGAFTGAVSGAVTALMDEGADAGDAAARRALIRQATNAALGPWRR